MAKKQDPIEEMLIADALRKFVPEAPAIHKHYIQLNKLLGKAKHDEDVKSLALAVQEMLKDVEFSAWIARDKTVPKTLTTANDCWTVAKRYLYRILWGRDYAGAALLLWGPEIFDPRPRSVGLIMDALSSSSLVNAMGGASSGKCLGKGTPVMMFDGTVKPVEDVIVGDELMGDDSTPRKVLSLARGREKLYRVVPSHGDSWVCNESHILSLKCSTETKTRHGKPISGYTKGAVRDISIKDYKSASTKFKSAWKQYRVPVEFSEKQTTVDPYCYGAWLADGGVGVPVVHKPECGMTRRWCEYWESVGARISKGSEDRCDAWYVRFDLESNPCTDFVRSSFINGEKRILKNYLTGSREVRLKLLAGLLDGDGHASGSVFEISTKYDGLAEDILFLARSLGFYARCSDKVSTIKSTGFSGIYNRIYISGDCTKIPTLDKHTRKRCGRDELLQSIELEDLGEGDYYGFTIGGNHRFLLGDFTVTHNTYSGIAWALLDWILDPEWTMIRLVGPTHDHLQQNMFADLVRLHEGSVIPLPGKVDTESLSTNKTRGMGFSTVALDRGPAASAKLKGIKTKPRDANDHPLFGRSARVRILIDEAQEVPINAWDMLLNAISNRESDEHLKIYCAANPSDENSKYGKNCKPLGGWATITPLQEKWVSETGWTTVRLNAMLSENVKAAKDNDEFRKRKLVIFPRLISWEKVSHIIRGAGGDDQDARVYTQVYGMFPPSGIKQSVIKQAHVEASKGEWIFTGPTTTYLTFDPAYSGDRPAVASGRYGLARGWIDYDGEIHKLDAPLKAIQIDTVGVIPQSDDTQAMVDDVLELAKQLRVAPECFGIDKTGVGRGCHDLIRMQWATTILGKQTAEPSDILGICYSESASETKVLDEDTSTPSELYDNTSSELWYAAGKLFERGVIKIGKGVDALAIDELVGRNGGRVTGKARRQAVETKPAYKARGNRSPDFADAITMLIHTVRLREDFSPKAEKTPDEAPVSPYEVDRAWDAANPFGTPAGMEELQKDETKISWNDLLGNN